MSTFSEVSLIIPTVHHRASLFARALRHAQNYRFNGAIVVSDHSPAGQTHTVRNIVLEHPNLNIVLLNHSPDMHFLHRLADCARHTSTTYVHLHADDDFLVFASLPALLDHMDKDSGCVAAMGINLNVDIGARQYFIIPKGGIGHDSAEMRLLSQLENYSSVLYALRRREELIASLEFSVERCPDVQFWQYLESCVAAVKGKITVSDDLHYIRENHLEKWSRSLVREKSRDHFPYLILSENFHPRLEAFRRAIGECAAGSGFTPDEEKLAGALVHLMNRGLSTMGLPAINATADNLLHTPLFKAQRDILDRRLANPQDPAHIYLSQVFSLAPHDAG